MCEYRAAIGAFAWIAVNAGLRWRSKSKKQKSSRLRAVGGEESFEKGETFNSVQKRGRSLNRGRSRDRSGYVGQRSRTLNQREIRSRQHVILRARSQSHHKKRKRVASTSMETFKSSCITCKTKVFDQKWRRGRSRQREKCKGTRQDKHCSPDREGVSNNTSNFGATKLHFLKSVAASGYGLLEKTIFTIIQMLLVRSGVETNPGPTTPTSSSCCNACQHFNKVKNTIAKVQKSFQSKVTQDTLTKKVVEIEETGIYDLLYKKL